MQIFEVTAAPFHVVSPYAGRIIEASSLEFGTAATWPATLDYMHLQTGTILHVIRHTDGAYVNFYLSGQPGSRNTGNYNGQMWEYEGRARIVRAINVQSDPDFGTFSFDYEVEMLEGN